MTESATLPVDQRTRAELLFYIKTDIITVWLTNIKYLILTLA